MFEHFKKFTMMEETNSVATDSTGNNAMLADSKTAYPEIKQGQPFICDGRMYIIKTMDNATSKDNLENGQSIFILQPID